MQMDASTRCVCVRVCVRAYVTRVVYMCAALPRVDAAVLRRRRRAYGC